MTACWAAVASAEHVAIGRAQGFMQVGHGKGAPLKRLHAGDRIACYSPVRVFGAKDACQAFSALGAVSDERVYQGTMTDSEGCDFNPSARTATGSPRKRRRFNRCWNRCRSRRASRIGATRFASAC